MASETGASTTGADFGGGSAAAAATNSHVGLVKLAEGGHGGPACKASATAASANAAAEMARATKDGENRAVSCLLPRGWVTSRAGILLRDRPRETDVLHNLRSRPEDPKVTPVPGSPALRAERDEFELDRALRLELFAPRSAHLLGATDLARTSGVWMGFGLCSARGLTEGLPADALIMLTAAEHLRRTLGLDHTTVLVADSNALAVGHEREQVEAVAEALERTLARLATVLEWPVLTLRGSEIASWSSVARVHTCDGEPYARHQIAQMSAMASAGSRIKVGWVMSSGARDESYFDALYQQSPNEGMAFAYTVCGRALDHRRPRACPYVSNEASTRVMLRPGETIEGKLELPLEHPDRREVAGYRKLLRKIGRGIARLHRTRAPRNAEAVVQRIIDEL